MIRQLTKLFLLSACLVACGQKVDTNPVLTIEGGQVQGVETTIPGVIAYKGIPYAAAPIGELRWKAPQPVTPWEGVKIADTYGAPCIQPKHRPEEAYTSEFFFDGDPEFSEDCLYLNVFTKYPGQKDKKLPVAMWIHGGGYVAGWGWEPEMDGVEWANRDVVLVTFNYRLGVYGFLTHPLLTQESHYGVSGNYGIMDQIACLNWIHDNIAQFGGDPDNITIFGQSAGAGSVKALVSSPLTGNLIKKAVIQSGGGVSETPRPATPLEQVSQAAKEVLDWGGYDTLEKMRAASVEELQALQARYMEENKRYAPLSSGSVIDGYVNVMSFDQAAKEGKIKNIPYMIGYTLNDMGSFSAHEAVDRFCSLREAAGIPAYSYEFVRILPDNPQGTHALKGAFHSSELWYTFKSLGNSDRPMTPGDYDLAEKMITCWTNFVKTGDPGEGWKPNTAASHQYMIFNADDQKAICAMGAPILPQQ